MELIDSHCHLDFEPFDSDRAELIQRCAKVGVNRFVVPGVQPSQWAALAELSKTYSGVYFAVGVHPWWSRTVLDVDEKKAGAHHNLEGRVANEEGNLTENRLASLLAESSLTSLLSHPKCVAIGECGLDKLHDVSLSKQRNVLEWHCELANRHQLPMICHSVKTHSELLDVIKHSSVQCGGVVHGYTGSEQTAKQFWEKGFYIGVGGSITYPRARKTRDAIKALPLECMLLETDAPDMPLCGKQGQRNSPEYLIEVAKCVAKLKGISLAEVAEVTRQNAERLFRLSD